jgi:hypothetical protein
MFYCPFIKKIKNKKILEGLVTSHKLEINRALGRTDD